jgi:hypothetical protein
LARKHQKGSWRASRKWHSFRFIAGVGLKVGGEGMKGFYDKMLPSEVNKYVKKLDKSVKVGTEKVSVYRGA